ncbi:MAG: hypothetical protein CMM02_07335 [Rhodopirellula sp.]|nr:hypothetical protein [Rhodopirellula sp.]
MFLEFRLEPALPVDKEQADRFGSMDVYRRLTSICNAQGFLYGEWPPRVATASCGGAVLVATRRDDMAYITTTDGRRRIFKKALISDDKLDYALTSITANNAGQFSKLAIELLGSVIQCVLTLTPSTSFKASASEALHSAQSVLRFSVTCKYVWNAYRGLLPQRLEVAARRCTSIQASLEATSASEHQQPFYQQVLLEERSRIPLKVLEQAHEYVCLDVATDINAKARRSCNLVMSSPNAKHCSELLKEAFNGRIPTPRVKVANALKSSRGNMHNSASPIAVVKGAGTHCAISLEHVDLATMGRGDPRPRPWASEHAAVFGPNGYLHLENVPDRVASGLLVLDDARKNQAAAHMEAVPTCALPLFSESDMRKATYLHRPPVVRQMRFDKCGNFLAVVSQRSQHYEGDAKWMISQETDVRVFRTTPYEAGGKIDGKEQLVLKLKGDCTDDYTSLENFGWEQAHLDGRIEVWFCDKANTLNILDASDLRRLIRHCHTNDRRQAPALYTYKRVGSGPDWVYEEQRCEQREEDRAGGWLDRVCNEECKGNDVDKGLVSFDCTCCGTFTSSVWRLNSGYTCGTLMQWTIERETPDQLGGHLIAKATVHESYQVEPLNVKILPPGNAVAAICLENQSRSVKVKIFATAKSESSYFDADANAYGAAPAFHHLYTVEAAHDFNNQWSDVTSHFAYIDVFSDGRTALSPCGRFLVATMKYLDLGVAIIDLCPHQLEFTWNRLETDVPPAALAWNSAGIWVQTKQGVLLLGHN